MDGVVCQLRYASHADRVARRERVLVHEGRTQALAMEFVWHRRLTLGLVLQEQSDVLKAAMSVPAVMAGCPSTLVHVGNGPVLVLELDVGRFIRISSHLTAHNLLRRLDGERTGLVPPVHLLRVADLLASLVAVVRLVRRHVLI